LQIANRKLQIVQRPLVGPRMGQRLGEFNLQFEIGNLQLEI
jgi:hypothetical protein